MLQRLPSKTTLALLGIVGLTTTVAVLLIGYFILRSWFGLPPNVFGAAEGPTQPIAFPHDFHVQTLGLDCTYCHRQVATENFAGIPPVEQCMFCHGIVGQGLPEIEKLKNYYSTDTPINWVRVHRLPDNVRFVHEAHITFFTQQKNISASQVCSMCHGDVANMKKVDQVRSLKMGDCVDCHRQNDAPTDCTTCHY